jgi:hypothetical protein
VAHICNPRYLESKNWEEHDSMPVQAPHLPKKVSETPISIKKIQAWWHCLYSSYEGGIGKEDSGPEQLRQKCETLPKKELKHKRLEAWFNW